MRFPLICRVAAARQGARVASGIDEERVDRLTAAGGSYGIPYLALVSRSLSNLVMAGRCISVDCEVYGSTRVMATCMAVGEAAGLGAALAAGKGIAPAEVPHGEIRERLIAGGAILQV